MSNKNVGRCLACRSVKPPLYRSKIDGNLYCSRHWNQMYKFGKITSIPIIHGRFKPNKAFKIGDTVEIVLENRKREEIARTIIDASDYGKVVSYRWYLSEKGYVRAKFMREGKWERARLHVLLLGKKDGFVTDHVDGDPLNNRRINLRHVTLMQSSWNTSNTMRSTVYKTNEGFVSNFDYKKKLIKLGVWDTKEEALDIATKFKRFLHGEHGYNISRNI